MDNLDKIFKAYDVRGIYPNEINEDLAYKFGRGVARFLKAKEIVVGRDNRLSSDSLFSSLCEGILDEGINILDIGVVTTPIFYLVVAKYDYDAGAMITASHNPKEYNGFKVVKTDAMPVGLDSGLDKVKKMIKNGFPRNLDGARGHINRRDVLPHYLKNILRFVDMENLKPLKIVVDTANGTAGPVIKELINVLPIKIIHIFSELDGSFPNHQPNPITIENVRVLQEKVLSEKADFGVAFDGDGDRIIFLDEKGEMINPNFIAALIINKLFQKMGARISFDTPTSWVVGEEIEKSGNSCLLTKVGHTFLKERILKHGVIFAAESSGHYYWINDYSVESPFFVLFKVLEIVSKEGKSLSALIKPFERYSLERFTFETKDADKKIKAVEKFYKKPSKLSRYDGLTVEYPNWWFNIRKSNTESVVRLTIEAKTKTLLEKRKKEIFKLIPFSS